MDENRERLVVRDATSEDLEEIVGIYNSTISSRVATADTEPVSVESRREWLLDRHERRPVWVADAGVSGDS